MTALLLLALAAPTLRQSYTITATAQATITVERPVPTVYACIPQRPPFVPAGWPQAVFAEPGGRVVGIADGKGGVLVNGVTVTPGVTQGVR